MLCKIGVLKNSAKVTGKHLYWSLFFEKKILKKEIRHRCFPVKYANKLGAYFFLEHLRWLLLKARENRYRSTTKPWIKQKQRIGNLVLYCVPTYKRKRCSKLALLKSHHLLHIYIFVISSCSFFESFLIIFNLLYARK